MLADPPLIAVAAHPARPAKEDAARQQMEQAERARAAEQAAQQEAAARAAAAAAEAQRLAGGPYRRGGATAPGRGRDGRRGRADG